MSAQSHPSAVESYLVRVDTPGASLEGQLAMPAEPRGVVLFAHGSGSSRHSPRNKFVAQALREDVSVGTLLIDLLSAAEDAIDARTARLRFDIGFLASRLISICDWLATDRRTHNMPLGLFGASTGAAAALIAGAERPDDVAAIVSRGGRPDLAGAAVARVRAPTLLIVGGDDVPVLDLNRQAMQRMKTVCELTVIPNAGHLFEEPGKLLEVSRRASAWFNQHLPGLDDRDEPRG
ncbi:MAG: dienelactone hydrolase [Labilithrix sp.]|nr:dienelactone hydrolase [Labilithrix sp.]